MTPELTIALLGLLFTLLAVPFLLRSLRQFRATDTAMYDTLTDPEPDYSAPPAPVNPKRARLMLFALGLAFVSIIASVGITVLTAPGATPGSKPVLKCPF